MTAFGIDLRLAAAGLVLLAACSPPPLDTPAPTQAATLAADTVADRAHWYVRLRWPADCEDAFQATRATDDSGLALHPLASGATLVIVRCAQGAYQPSSVVMLDAASGAGNASLLSFPIVRPANADNPPVTELFGDLQWLPAAQELTLLSLSRQIGDCGTWARYAVADGRPRLVAAAAQFDCPDPAGPSADPPTGQPPTDWPVVWPQ